MTGILVLAVLALALIAGLEYSNRRHADASSAAGRSVSWSRNDRDVARTKLDMLALAGRSEPFARKPFARSHHHVPLRGRHAA